MSLQTAEAAAAWFTQALGQPCRLVRQQTGSRRSVSLPEGGRQQQPSPGRPHPAEAEGLPGSLGVPRRSLEHPAGRGPVCVAATSADKQQSSQKAAPPALTALHHPPPTAQALPTRASSCSSAAPACARCRPACRASPAMPCRGPTALRPAPPACRLARSASGQTWSWTGPSCRLLQRTPGRGCTWGLLPSGPSVRPYPECPSRAALPQHLGRRAWSLGCGSRQGPEAADLLLLPLATLHSRAAAAGQQQLVPGDDPWHRGQALQPRC